MVISNVERNGSLLFSVKQIKNAKEFYRDKHDEYNYTGNGED
jgi:hypothetical protein